MHDGEVNMSKLNEAIQVLAPVTRPEAWEGECWTGDGSVRARIAAALTDMTEVDEMMTEIARATSVPQTPEERTGRAVDMAAAEMRYLDSAMWPGWIIELLEMVKPSVSDAQYSNVLKSSNDLISARLGRQSG
jgi:hypothetical protein